MRHPYSPRPAVFSSISPAEIARLDRLGTCISLPPQSLLYRQEEQATHVYRLMEGRIHLRAGSEDGHELIVRVMYPGDALGLTAVIGAVPYETSAQAATQCLLHSIPAKAFLEILAENPRVSACVSRALSEEYLDILEHTRTLHLAGTTPARVARVILELAVEEEDSISFPIPFTHSEIADMIGCSRESVSRVLKNFRQQHYIETHDHSMTVLNPDRLIALGNV